VENLSTRGWVWQKGVWGIMDVCTAPFGSNAKRQTSVSCLLYRSLHWDPALHFVAYFSPILCLYQLICALVYG
jgi:hypothetical protein